MYVVGLMYHSTSFAATIKRALCALPGIAVHLFSPPRGYREAGHLDVLITDCTEADLLSGRDESLAVPPADVVLVVATPLPGNANTSMLSTVVRATMLNAQPESPAEAPPLSERERQVLTCIGTGYTHDQTARRLGISPHTVDTYVKRIRGKLGIGNKAELARAAFMYG
jgi:DNA-binding CsgD family transcriptional regulator